MSPNAEGSKGWASSSVLIPLEAGSPTPTLPGPALQWHPGKVQGPLSQVLKLVTGWTNFPVLMLPRPALPPGTNSKGPDRRAGVCSALPLSIFEASSPATLYLRPSQWHPFQQGQHYCAVQAGAEPDLPVS